MARRKRPEVTEEQLAALLKKHNGLMTLVAEDLGYSYSAIWDRVNRSEVLKQIRNDVTERLLDKCENKLQESIDAGNISSIMFYLKCQGKSRGYVEKQNVIAEINVHDDWILKAKQKRNEVKLRKAKKSE